jgi:hypothetical protein
MSKRTVLPNTTRLELPDIRFGGHRLTQPDRRAIRSIPVGKGKPFSRVGEVGPTK